MSVGTKIDVSELLGDLKFIKGSLPTTDVEASRVIVFEFWATWCPPCRQSIPHLSEVQAKYKSKDVFLVGVTNERNPKQIEQFVSQMGSQMDYVVALDPSNTAQEALMVPAGARGIPHAFILDPSGVVTWQGHPMESDFESALSKVAAKATSRVKFAPVTESVEELMGKSVKELKTILQDRGVYFADCVEKGDLAKRIVERCSKV
ncbi:thioredoxin-like protein [Gonapodya prolifera JEL478]|uniref:Thioredoxin-like protein n=1 Tax=Gonapodya prolifera (strain JEL478) TaxID=1344416 RepID=A0A139A210_GONPJ|nr:thioredoxin-like protein [Gonapodya prolifera JEL478]|eukprot:KXS10826.1 thioredoxin-like protein [Gonapodya prolifera JEL478]